MEIYKTLWNEIIKHDSIVILTHVNADGDTIGSAVALKHMILDNSDIKNVYISGEKYPKSFNWMENNDDVSDEAFNNSQIIVVDTATKSRVVDSRVITEEALLIDHHHEEGNWKMGIGGDNFPATGEILYYFAKENNLKLSQKARDGIFVAIWTDTEAMTERAPKKSTWDALNDCSQNKEAILEQLEPSDEDKAIFKELIDARVETENLSYSIIDTFIPNEIVKPAIFDLVQSHEKEVTFASYPSDGDVWRLSFRSKGNIDVSGFAKTAGGGGHFASSGAQMESKQDVLDFVEKLKIWVKKTTK